MAKIFFTVCLVFFIKISTCLCNSKVSPNKFCLEPVDEGSCSRIGWEGFTRYYFSNKTKSCHSFQYSGCGGNNNRFYEKIICDRVCAYYTNVEAYKQAETVDVNLLLDKSNVGNEIISQLSIGRLSRMLCGSVGLPLRMPTGPRDATQCHIRGQPCPIGYHCVLGPKNYPYPVSVCCPSTWPLPEVIHEDPPSTNASDLLFTMRPEWCLLRPSPGPCRSIARAWYYDIDRGICVTFTYGGCGGNRNRFTSRFMCESTCIPVVVHLGNQPPPPPPPPVIPEPNPVLPLPPARCRLAPDSGPSLNFSYSFYFEEALESCLPLAYGGCGGNANRFDTEFACLVACRPEMFVELSAEARRRHIVMPTHIPTSVPPCSLPPLPPTSPTRPPVTRPPVTVPPINYFKHPSIGYSECQHSLRCLLDPCSSARCPEYPEAVCRPNLCSGCLAEFYIDNQRVNCSSTDPIIQAGTRKLGRCPLSLGLPYHMPCPNGIIDRNGVVRPLDHLCSADAECFADQKCCRDICYGSLNLHTCQTPYKKFLP